MDKLDVADILDGYDYLSDAISDFVRITDNGTHSVLSVDGNSFIQIAQLSSVTNIAAGATATELTSSHDYGWNVDRGVSLTD